MSEMKQYLAGHDDASHYFKCDYGKDDNRLIAMNHALQDIIDPDTLYDSAYIYGYLDVISKVLRELINEARSETITTYIKEEEQNGSREDDSGSEGSTLSGDRDDNGEAGGAEEDRTNCDGSDQDSPEADRQLI